MTLPEYWHLVPPRHVQLTSGPGASCCNAFLLKFVRTLYHNFFLKVEPHVLWSNFDLTDVGRNCSSLQNHASLQIYPNNKVFNWIWWTKNTAGFKWNITGFFSQIPYASSLHYDRGASKYFIEDLGHNESYQHTLMHLLSILDWTTQLCLEPMTNTLEMALWRNHKR